MAEFTLGLSEFVAALDGLAAKAQGSAEAAATAGALLVERRVKASELSRYSHSKGTRTPSPPGQPPAIITGTLRRSMTTQQARPVGFGRYEAVTGPTVVYARIQELGGFTGRGHRTYLPPRPYVAPGLRAVLDDGSLETLIRDTFAAGLTL